MSVFLTHGRQPHFSFLKKEHGAEGAGRGAATSRRPGQEAWEHPSRSASMSAIDFKKLLAEARAERSRAAVKQAAPGAPTPTAAAARQPEPEPELLLPELPPLTVTSRPPLTHADYDVGGGLSVRAGAPEVAAGGLLYIPEFITAEEEAALLGLLYCPMAAKRWGGGTGTGEAQRRTQNWGGRPGSVDTGELPQFARQLVTALVSAGVFEPQHAPNHVLVNECVATAHLPLPPVAITNAAATAAISLRGGYGYIPPACRYGRAGGLVAHTDGPLCKADCPASLPLHLSFRLSDRREVCR